MPQNAAVFNPFAPWLAWWTLATQTAEMLFASGHVIGTRVHRMASAGHNPSARDRREFLRMGTEKVEAATKSGLAMARWWSTAWQPWLAGTGSMLNLSNDAVRLASVALAPVHATATANARRLSRLPAPSKRRGR